MAPRCRRGRTKSGRCKRKTGPKPGFKCIYGKKMTSKGLRCRRKHDAGAVHRVNETVKIGRTTVGRVYSSKKGSREVVYFKPIGPSKRATKLAVKKKPSVAALKPRLEPRRSARLAKK